MKNNADEKAELKQPIFEEHQKTVAARGEAKLEIAKLQHFLVAKQDSFNVDDVSFPVNCLSPSKKTGRSRREHGLIFPAKWQATLGSSFSSRGVHIAEQNIYDVDFDSKGNIKWDSVDCCTEETKAILAEVCSLGSLKCL